MSTYFGKVSQYAAMLVTPYMAFTLYLLVAWGFLWYYNEGKEAMAELKGEMIKKKKNTRGVPLKARVGRK